MKYLIICISIACAAFYGCQEIEEPINNIPTVTTNEVTKIGTTTAYLTGEISTTNFNRGKFLLSTTEDFAECQEVDARSEGMEFYADAEGLTTGTTYYCVLSVTDGRSELKGDVVKFTTQNRFEFSNVTHSLWENGETSSFVTEKNMGTFFFYDEKFRNNNIETYCTLDAPKWIPNADIPLDTEWMLVYAYWPYAQTYKMGDYQPYIWVENNGQDYLYGVCEYIPNENTSTNMHMNHAMSRITFTVNKTEDCDTEGTVSEIILIDNGKTLYCNGNMDVTTGEIVGLEPMGSTSIQCKFELSHETPSTVEQLMFPASFGENQVQVGIKIAETNEVIYQYLPAGEWKKGQSYNYPITLTKKEPTEGDFVDLGLPSGTLWASRNVGANSPEDVGGYYAWGEIEEKTYYMEYNYTGGTNSYNSDILDLKDDVAHAKMGKEWRMPTVTEAIELITECDWERGTYNGTVGCYVISKSNGNCIFLPSGGHKVGKVDFISDEGYGHYWTSSEYEHASDEWAYALNAPDFSGEHLNPYAIDNKYRVWGLPVRPVLNITETTTALIVGDVQVENWEADNEGGTIIVQ